MPVAYNFKRGIDLPEWAWLNQFPLTTISGGSNAWDGSRYIYYNSSTSLYRFDTWTDSWQFLATTVAATAGSAMEYDSIRNVLWISITTTTWYVFNLNTTPITIGSLVTGLAAWTLSAALAPALTTAIGAGSSFEMLEDTNISFLCLDDKAATSRNSTAVGTTTTLNDTGAEFHGGMIGCYVKYISGANNGLSRVVTAAATGSLTTTAFPSPQGAADAYFIEPPGFSAPLAATGGTTTTLVATGSGWTTNIYRDADVTIVGGTGAGQRRRIASNDGTTLTLAGAVTGNPRTGPFGTAPDGTSTFKITPSADFLYYTVATNTTTFYRMDVVATTNTWVVQTVAAATLGAGHNLLQGPSAGPFSLYASRGNAQVGAYRYDIGLQTWTTLPWMGAGEVLTTGSNTAKVAGRNRLFITISATTRCYLYNFVTGLLEPVTSAPYAVPTALDGQRARCLKTADGAEFVYMLRTGGQELFRLPLEWL